MPIYAYRCTDCGFEKDYLRKVADPVLIECPKCGKPTLTKQLTAAGFQLKGSGWYATDFKGGAKPAETQLPETKPAESETKPADGKSAAIDKPKAEAPAKDAASVSADAGGASSAST